MRTFLKIWLLPPLSNIVLILAGLFLLNKARRLAKLLIWTGVISLYVFSTPWFSEKLLLSIDSHPALAADDLPELAEHFEKTNTAIVVLGGGHRASTPQYNGPTLRESAVIRLNYGVWLASNLDLPFMVTGGVLDKFEGRAHADVMADYVRRHWQIQPNWIENESRTTYENALFAKKRLAPENVENIVLVTHAYHMRRAVKIFEARGFNVTPAPIESALGYLALRLHIFAPSSAALLRTSAVMHEYLGLLWYSVVGYE